MVIFEMVLTQNKKYYIYTQYKTHNKNRSTWAKLIRSSEKSLLLKICDSLNFVLVIVNKKIPISFTCHYF